MRMRVDIVWRTVSCPARMPHADSAMCVFFGNMLFKVGNFSFAFVNSEFGIKNGNTRAVVSSVFKAVKPFNKDGIRFFTSDVCYYTAHKLVQSLRFKVAS